jgi:hypothetical protein
MAHTTQEVKSMKKYNVITQILSLGGFGIEELGPRYSPIKLPRPVSDSPL